MGFEDQKNDQLQIPKIRFEGLDLSQAGSPRWDSARSHVIAALQTYGCFDAVYGVTAPELKGMLFGRPVLDLFELGLQEKLQNTSDKPFLGYIGNSLPNVFPYQYESLRVVDAHNLESVEKFARLLWPGGNPNFWYQCFAPRK